MSAVLRVLPRINKSEAKVKHKRKLIISHPSPSFLIFFELSFDVRLSIPIYACMFVSRLRYCMRWFLCVFFSISEVHCARVAIMLLLLRYFWLLLQYPFAWLFAASFSSNTKIIWFLSVSLSLYLFLFPTYAHTHTDVNDYYYTLVHLMNVRSRFMCFLVSCCRFCRAAILIILAHMCFVGSGVCAASKHCYHLSNYMTMIFTCKDK